MDVTRALRGCFGGGSLYVPFRFKAKETSNAVDKSSLRTTSKGASVSK